VQATKQQQIMVFFIEEAKEHLDTIEQGLLNLQATMSDPEQMNELFRAAHSVKGGAAMLGFDSIQKVSHYLEDYFKILKENAIKPDRQLEDLFLKGFDALKELVEGLQSPYGLQDEHANQIVQAAQPTFANLNNYLNRLIQRGATGANTPVRSSVEILGLVNAVLKKMLEFFKQGDTPGGRQQLASLCGRMTQLSPSPEWHQVLKVSQGAIANPKVTYQILAPHLIKELKQAGDLLAAGRTSEIVPSQNLEKLAGVKATVVPQPMATQTIGAELTSAQPATAQSRPVAAPVPSSANNRAQQISVPLEPRAAARVLLDAFSKDQLIVLAEFLMKAIQ
jgi:chemotaxis protein histidine kinase CheA